MLIYVSFSHKNEANTEPVHSEERAYERKEQKVGNQHYFERNIGWKEESGMVRGISNMHISHKKTCIYLVLKSWIHSIITKKKTN